MRTMPSSPPAASAQHCSRPMPTRSAPEAIALTMSAPRQNQPYGSFCRGTDIVKAIALGADLVGIGRLQCWALAAAGEAGVLRMLELLEDEVIRCLGLLGVTKFAKLDKSYLHAATPTNLPHVFSAFPLLEIEPYRY